MLVRGGGLAEGTVIAPGGVATSGGITVVTLNDASGNPAVVGTGPSAGPPLVPPTNIFNQGDILTFFDNPNIVTPGIQYLAV
jgi:hypothetical protein